MALGRQGAELECSAQLLQQFLTRSVPRAETYSPLARVTLYPNRHIFPILINGLMDHTFCRNLQENNCPQTMWGCSSVWRHRHCLSNGWKVYKKTANFVLWLLNWSSTLLEPGFFGNFAVVTTIFFTYCYRKGTLFNLIEDTIKNKYTGAFNKNSMRRTFKAK